MVCLNSRCFVYVFKTRMHDLKTFECSNSSQKVWILLKKLREIMKSSSYREKFIQGTNKFVRPTKMFEFSSIQVFFAWKGLVGSRDWQICTTYQDVRDLWVTNSIDALLFSYFWVANVKLISEKNLYLACFVVSTYLIFIWVCWILMAYAS